MKRKKHLIVGAGLYGAICARELTEAGHSVLLIEKRDHIAGNAFTETIESIHVHRYGAYIFHTNDASVWEYVQHFAISTDRAVCYDIRVEDIWNSQF